MKDLVKLIKEKKFHKALEMLNAIQESDKNFYESLKLKGFIYLEQKEYQKALDLATSELKMPYIPKGYQEVFDDIQREARANLNINKGFRIISSKELEEALFREKDTFKANALILQLRNLNIMRYMNLFIKYLLWNKGDDILKSTILYFLKENGINHNFRVVKGENEFFINPQELIETNLTEEFKKGEEIIEKKFFQEISKKELAVKMYFTLLYAKVPLNISIKEVKNEVTEICKKVEKLFK